MKKILSLVAAILFLGANIFAQEQDTIQDNNSSKIKKGWKLGGVLPTITYNSDLGFQYGGLIDVYNYGEGGTASQYLERFYLEISRFTKGSGINNFSMESKRLFKGRRVFFDINYQPDEQFDFLGANGYESVYNTDWIDPESTDYRSKMFYKNQTKRLRAKFDVLHPITDSWSWVSGIEYYNYKINTVDVAKYNDGKDAADQIPQTSVLPGLWDRYKAWGIIDSTEVDGGSFGGLKLGLMYDTRDNEILATNGIWSELTFIYAPKFLSSTNHNYIKLNFTHRQYFTLVKDRLTFAYRLGYKGNIWGNEPYYSMPIMYSVMIRGAVVEGLGGSRSLRGVIRNRVVGDGEAYANAEFRWKFAKFKLFGQNIYLATNVFVDAGQVVSLLPLEDKVNSLGDLTDGNIWGAYAIETNITLADGSTKTLTKEEAYARYFNFGSESLHTSFGAGFKIAINEVFVVSIDYGKTINIQDGPSGMYINLNYIF